MDIKKILVSQPRPSSEKSPYFELEKKYGVEIVFRPFIKVEGLSSREFRKSKIAIPEYSAIILTARVAVDHFFRLCKELRYNVPDTLKYFCVSETIARYLQKYIIYRKRKIFYSESGRIEDLIPIIAKHHKETYLMPVSDVHNDKAVVLDANRISYVKAVMYRTVSNDFKPGEPFDYDMLAFFSPSGIKSYVNNFPDYAQRNVVIAAMGQSTLEAASQAGIDIHVTPSPQAPSMSAAIEQFLKAAPRLKTLKPVIKADPKPLPPPVEEKPVEEEEKPAAPVRRKAPARKTTTTSRKTATTSSRGKSTTTVRKTTTAARKSTTSARTTTTTARKASTTTKKTTTTTTAKKK